MALSADAARLGATTSRTLNKLAFALANDAADITTATTSDRIPMVDASADYAVKYADGDNVLEMAGITATAAEINAAADISGNTQLVVAGGGAVTLPAGGGTVLIPLVTANVTTTLPATPTLGLRYDFYFVGTATDAEDWVLTAAAFFSGGLVWNTHGTPDIELVYADGSTHNTLTVNNPATGTTVTAIGNGTTWSVTGTAVAANTPAFSAV